MACCSMRGREPRYRVFDAQGRLVQILRSESRARNLALGVQGRYEKEWVDPTWA